MKNIIIPILLSIISVLIGCEKSGKNKVYNCNNTTEIINFYNGYGVHWEECDLLNSSNISDKEIDYCQNVLFENIKVDSIINITQGYPPFHDSIDINPIIYPVPFVNSFRIDFGRALNAKHVSIRITDSDFNVIFSKTYHLDNSRCICLNTETVELMSMKLYNFYYAFSDENLNIFLFGLQAIIKVDSYISYEDLCDSLRKM